MMMTIDVLLNKQRVFHEHKPLTVITKYVLLSKIVVPDMLMKSLKLMQQSLNCAHLLN